ncbi:RnfABCDGE type electron transport complex subunit G [Pseudomaricurvus sp. HS19]|uniref:RnfABCDGE type electron transport complex subunit G n=1 Tax=Pseudomaricurvus sp. HS19 TaxID=2692626 RepID=UPI00136933A6|nr:RnfABCDGE type electron transport complex subunit G [Pseudomaricurvus sp. HS19]MYM62263.1 RnfABCDGE type electron transport complex subunit G [Pseudomaricurvus sp. HS19]
MATVASPSYRQRVSYHAGLLAGICCLVSMLLLIGNMESEEIISDHLEADKQFLLGQVLPAALYDNAPLREIEVLDNINGFTKPVEIAPAMLAGQLSAVVLQSSVGGWGDNIQFIIAADKQGNITGVRVISHKETPGLADGIELDKSDWITRFNGHSLQSLSPSQWAVKKDGGEFDQFTGATITPRAMVNGVHRALEVMAEWQQQQLASQPPREQEQQQPPAAAPATAAPTAVEHQQGVNP